MIISKLTFLQKFLAVIVIVFGVLMIFSQPTQAAVVLSPDPGIIPADIRSYLVNSDLRPNSPSLIGWVARQGFPAQQSLVIPSNVTDVDLSYHSIGTVGFRPSSTTRTRYYVESASAGVTGIQGQYNELVFSPNQNTVGATRMDSWDFNFAPPGGFPVSDSYYVELNTRIINEFSNGSFFRCVANGASASSLSNYSACPLTKQVFEIYVTVPPSSVPGCTDSNATNYNPAATVDDGSCIYPVPGCTDSNAINYNPAATVNNGSCIYPVPGCIDVNAVNYNPAANVNDGSCIYDVCNNLTGNQPVIPPGYSSDGAGGCVYPAPNCGPSESFSIAAGLSFTTKKSFKNDNSIDMPVSNANYTIGSIVTSTAATPASTTITPGNSAEFSSQAHTIDSPGVYTITWTVNYEFGTKDCSDEITVTVVEPSCSVTAFSIGTLDRFVPRVTITNDNYVPLNITSATYLTNPAKISGSATTGSAPGRVNTTFDAPETTIDTPGEYVLIWTADWNIGSSSGTITCETENSTVSNQPYARFYGNDLFAGGGFGENCTTAGITDVLGFGTNSTHATYLGTASELAVFAIGQIQNVLPGSQRNRSSAQELAFANVASVSIQVDPATGRFGGGFGSVMCSPDYYGRSESVDRTLETTVDLSTLESGSYSYGNGLGSNIVLSTGTGVPDGRRLVVYIDGNVQITNAGAGRFGYANVAGNWASVSDVPSLYIIASGNIFIQPDIATMDGVYVAQPRFQGDDTTGKIYSCANDVTDPLANLDDRSAGGNAAFLLNNCASRLTINGAFMAKRVHLLRSLGTVNAGVPYETADSAGIAEVFRFAPELYLTEGGGLPPRSTNAVIDSILSMPPSF